MKTSGAVKEVSGVMLLREDGALLMQHRDKKEGIPYADYWSVPSGRKEVQETSEDCARREIAEETGYRPGALKFLATITGREDTGAEYCLTLFWERYDGLQKLQCLEGQGLEFVRRNEAHQYRMLPFIQEVWDQVLKGMAQNG